MGSADVALVAASTISHAYWNYVFKRANGGAAFVGLSKLVEVVVFAPLFAIALMRWRGSIAGSSVLVVMGAALVLVNYAALTRAYALMDLSLAYPIARAGALALLPLFGFMVFGEHLSMLGAAAVCLIVIGIVVMQMPSLSVRAAGAGVAFACVAALAAACYTIWDKRAVREMPAFVYFYGYTLIVALAYLAFLVHRSGMRRLAVEWRAKRWAIVQVGVLNTVSYTLVLVALRAGTSSYVVALRQLSIAWGVLFGAWCLGETIDRPRRIGLGLLLAGCVLVAMSK